MNLIRGLRNLVGITPAPALAALLLAACSTATNSPTASGFGDANSQSPGTETRLRVGDQIQVRIEAGSSVQTPQTYDVAIDETGEISLPLIGRVEAEGMTIGELTERIQANYVPRFYVRCNVIVLVTVRFFYVGGEVRSPSRYNWTDDITLLKAINTAGGFTDYANRRKVEVVRGKELKIFDCEDLRLHPAKDVQILPGDSIYVKRSIF